jgi:hypothetical protein
MFVILFSLPFFGKGELYPPISLINALHLPHPPLPFARGSFCVLNSPLSSLHEKGDQCWNF